jgi:hypothetical protein
MPLDVAPDREPSIPSCRACRQPIWQWQPTTRVDFQSDPDGVRGLTGTYHQDCAKPFQSMAQVLNMNPWSGF